ncbi:hypothetical protein GA0070622_1198 [Micromonospora sediminicola]|uniref:Uncharacterized protein n=1 Tax=Micromonospora sediminicola TaxID=946078 RepID=A0A1A9B550_9ACTN|nr:hypothetical protein [Micromonospora sediminicola]SBT64228.1 hypothetical protein GA0070622_1198 [Micromonospora sediminicola]
MTHLPTHPHLRHPRTGDPLRALGRTRSGRLIWPQLGAAPDPPAPAPGPGQPPADPGTGAPPANPGTGSGGGGQPPADPAPTGGDPQDKPLGPGGEKALREEREARKALERQIGELAPLKQLADLLGTKPTGDGKTDLEQLTERLNKHDEDLAKERAARWRAEVAHEKGLTPAQAARLNGGTRDELAADADALLQLFPAAPAGPRNPAPDPTQGTRGNQPADLEALIAAAQKSGNVREVIRLQKQKLTPVQQ